jgi:hypothetical protein
MRVLTLPAVALLAAALSISCGGGDDSTPTPAPTASGPPATTTRDGSPSPGRGATPGVGTPGATEDADGAVETLVRYYRLINDGGLRDAYALWARDGAASGHSLDEFSAGYRGTQRVSLLIDGVEPGSGEVGIRVSVLAVAEGEGPQGQIAQRFDGSYTLAQNGSQWEITKGDLRPATPVTPDDVAAALAVIHGYYDAVNARHPAVAYTYWADNGEASGQRYAAFAEGYETTRSVSIATGEPEMGAAAGSIYASIPVALVATQEDGSVRAFCGSYTLRRSNIPPFDELGWRIYSASTARVESFNPATGTAQSVLDAGC